MDPSVVTVSDFNSVISALTNQISVSSVVGVLAALVGVVVGLAFMWWGVRKGTSMLMSAFKKGRVNL